MEKADFMKTEIPVAASQESEKLVNPEAKAEDAEDGEKQEMTEEEKKAAELRQISVDLEMSRKEFMAKDSEMDKHKSVLEKLKVLATGNTPNLGAFQEEYDAVSANYQKSLETFKNALIAESMGDNEDAEIISKFVEEGEMVNMKKAKAEAQMEAAPFSEKIKNGFLNIAEKYRSLPIKNKLTIGVGLAGAGFVAGVAGGAMAAGAGTLMLGNRIFSSAVSATGFKAMFDSMAESGIHYRGINIKGENEKAEEATQKNIKESLAENGEVDFEKFSSKMKEKIAGMNEKFQKEKYSQKMRTVMAIGAGVAMAGIGKYVGGQASEYIRDHGGVKEVAGHAWDKFWDAVEPSEAAASELPANFSNSSSTNYEIPKQINKPVNIGAHRIGQGERLLADRKSMASSALSNGKIINTSGMESNNVITENARVTRPTGMGRAGVAEHMGTEKIVGQTSNIDMRSMRETGMSVEQWNEVKRMSLDEIRDPNNNKLTLFQKMKLNRIVEELGGKSKVGSTSVEELARMAQINKTI